MERSSIEGSYLKYEWVRRSAYCSPVHGSHYTYFFFPLVGITQNLIQENRFILAPDVDDQTSLECLRHLQQLGIDF